MDFENLSQKIIGAPGKIRSSLKTAPWLWKPAAAFFITRFAVFLIAYITVSLFQEPDFLPPYHLLGIDNRLLDVFASRWDTGFYISIAEEGYKYQGVDLPSVAFFPLLPLFIRAGTVLVGSPFLAGVLVTNLALLISVILLYKLVVMRWDSKVADRAVWYLLIFPASFFGSAIYTESLFLLWAVGALYMMRKGYWESALMMGVMASLTRFLGLLVAPLLFVEWLVQRKTNPGESQPKTIALLAPAAVPLGTLAYIGYLWLAFDDPLAFSRASEAWGRQATNPLQMLAGLFQAPAQGWGVAVLSGQIHMDNWIDFLTVLFFISLGLVLVYQRQWSEAVFVLLGAIIPVSSGLLMSQRRYMWVLFPAFILLARWGDNPWVDRLINIIFLTGLGVLTALFANGYWVG